jgi:hypothetical protein
MSWAHLSVGGKERGLGKIEKSTKKGELTKGTPLANEKFYIYAIADRTTDTREFGMAAPVQKITNQHHPCQIGVNGLADWFMAGKNLG